MIFIKKKRKKKPAWMTRLEGRADNIVRLPSALESSHTFCLWRLPGEHLMAMGQEENNRNDSMFSKV